MKAKCPNRPIQNKMKLPQLETKSTGQRLLAYSALHDMKRASHTNVPVTTPHLRPLDDLYLKIM